VSRERKLESLRCLCASESAAYLSTAVPVKQVKPHAEVRLERLPEPAGGSLWQLPVQVLFVPVKQIKRCKRCASLRKVCQMRQLELLGGWRLASALFQDIYEYMLLKRQLELLGALSQASALFLSGIKGRCMHTLKEVIKSLYQEAVWLFKGM
jgi:hypothetical protein